MMLPDVLTFVLDAASALLLLAGVAAVLVLWKGCGVLRRLARSNTRDDVPILLKSPRVPAVSAIAVARDASAQSRAFAHKLLELHFGHHELVLVLEGVSADEMAVWIAEFHLVPTHRSTTGELSAETVTAAYESTDPLSMLVLQTEPSLKPLTREADAWNTAVNAATSPVIAIFDPETEFAPESLLRLIRPMLDEPELVFAVCGTAPAPPAAGLSASYSDIEATRTWLVRCAAFAGLKNMLAPVPGSSILVRRDAILAAGGFPGGPLELFLHLQGRARRSGKPYRAEFVPEPVSFLPAPRTMGELRRRNLRDQRAIFRALGRSGAIMGGRFSLGWGLPALSLYRFWLPLLETAAIVAAIAALATGKIAAEVGLLVLLSTVGVGILVSMTSVILRELADFHGSDSARLTRLFWTAILENLGYRQIRNLWLISGALARR
jgi:hypothetical protein